MSSREPSQLLGLFSEVFAVCHRRVSMKNVQLLAPQNMALAPQVLSLEGVFPHHNDHDNNLRSQAMNSPCGSAGMQV